MPRAANVSKLRIQGAANASPVPDLVAELRELAETKPATAAALVWTLMDDLGRQREKTKLANLFGTGRFPGDDLSGSAEHDLVATLVHPVVDIPARLAASLLPRPLPWTGKYFDPATSTGRNEFRLLGRRIRAAGFDTYPESGAIDPSPRVLVISYPVPGRPIRDELVEIVPTVYLGRALAHLPGDRFVNVAYWRLRNPSG